MAVWIFFSLQPRLPKTAQDRKFILEMYFKTHLFSNLCVQDRNFKKKVRTKNFILGSLRMLLKLRLNLGLGLHLNLQDNCNVSHFYLKSLDAASLLHVIPKEFLHIHAFHLQGRRNKEARKAPAWTYYILADGF